MFQTLQNLGGEGEDVEAVGTRIARALNKVSYIVGRGLLDNFKIILVTLKKSWSLCRQDAQNSWMSK